MPGLGDFVKKAFYMGVGVASYAGEKAGSAIADLRPQAQKLANEMVERGEITAEEAKRMVEEIVNRAQQQVNQQETETYSVETLKEPRRIEIVDDDEPEPSTDDEQVNELRDQVNQLKEELKRLQKD